MAIPNSLTEELLETSTGTNYLADNLKVTDVLNSSKSPGLPLLRYKT